MLNLPRVTFLGGRMCNYHTTKRKCHTWHKNKGKIFNLNLDIMVKIENYMNDGANWQAMCVLAYLRSHVYVEDINKYATLSVGRFENCREQGYVFILRKNSDCLQRNYVVYEHRNFDAICIKIFDQWTLNTPTLEECLKHFRDKWDVDKKFECGHVVEAAQCIENDILEYLSIHNL